MLYVFSLNAATDDLFDKVNSGYGKGGGNSLLVSQRPHPTLWILCIYLLPVQEGLKISGRIFFLHLNLKVLKQ